MQILPRLVQNQVEKRLFQKKAIIIYGARQVGKTTLVKQIFEKYSDISLYLSCETFSVQQNLSVPDGERLKSYFNGKKLIILDEAQKIPNIGTIIKILVDTSPELQIIATGSSSFELASKANEPLTGREDRFILYPFSIEEINQKYDRFAVDAKLENLLRFGAYPEIFFLNEEESRRRLDDISTNYLYKDLLNFEGIKKSHLIVDLLRLLALQLGQEVSYQELANNLGVSRLTIQKYLGVLEQVFVIFTLRAFSRNLRKEISKSVKIYFYDLGIRNSLIQNFNLLSLRNDVGALWENLMIIERLKHNSYHQIYSNRYFWRTYDQKEVDYLEEREGKLFAFEFKWGLDKAKQPTEFLHTYPHTEFKTVNKSNYWEFVA